MNTLHEIYLQACNPTASPNRLRELAHDCRMLIRSRVAENVATPQDVLQLLSSDITADVRMAVALNDTTPLTLLWELANDLSADVRFAIAENPHVAVEILIWLSADDNPYVACRAEQTIEAMANDSPKQGGNDMSATNVERALRRALNRKERLNKADALRLKQMVLADGYLSRSERKVMLQTVEHDLLDEDAFEIFLDVLLEKYSGRRRDRNIA
jgi:hypothetical protein